VDDDLRRTAGRSWMRVAEGRARNWRGLCPAVDCSGQMTVMMMMVMVVMMNDEP
jgi:hypothetical protein